MVKPHLILTKPREVQVITLALQLRTTVLKGKKRGGAMNTGQSNHKVNFLISVVHGLPKDNYLKVQPLSAY